MSLIHWLIVTVLGLVGGAPTQGWGETPRDADSSAAGTGRFFHKQCKRLVASVLQPLASCPTKAEARGLLDVQVVRFAIFDSCTLISARSSIAAAGYSTACRCTAPSWC